jgi:hypothetical protein
MTGTKGRTTAKRKGKYEKQKARTEKNRIKRRAKHKEVHPNDK